MAETCDVLARAEIEGVGAGADIGAAQRPAVITLSGDRRVVIGSIATESSGVRESWAADRDRPGVWWIHDPSHRAAADEVAAHVLARKRTGDVAIVSVHWGFELGLRCGAE